ncbi:methyltransferase [Urechidicola vernalis]|uniref:DUF975 family protein n=1 Tax=Urechidicola vernalis TaxID=3075600 RepID=A0ABU2Y0Y1_9FLAO|nr:hypothetical protein [Urechidicola sp. P050]MDT0551795.1 hypothetical protein [Urechidicola sp. P050]
MKLLKYQAWHLLFLVISCGVLWYLIEMGVLVLEGSLFGITTYGWFVFALLIPIIHQVYVLICWRLELYYKSITTRFRANGFKMYKTGFFVLFIARFFTVILLALSSANSFEIDIWAKVSLIVLLTIPALYAFYSVKIFFGFDRAAGLDHFDKKISKEPFVKRGIFKYTSNGMYKFAFLFFYVPGVIWSSELALIVALFSHVYIWVHYYCTELPDIKHIYK